MGKFDGILICTDLDGTLLRNDKSVSDENKKAIEYFKSEGGIFTFVTGRMPYYSKDAFEKANPNAPFGCNNGGGLYDYDKQEYIWSVSLPESYVELVECIDKNFDDVGIQVATLNLTYFSKHNSATKRFIRLTNVPDLECGYRDIKEPAGKVIFCSENPDDIIEVEKTLKSHPIAKDFGFIHSERTLYEILPPDVDKGTSVEKLCECLNIDINKTIAIGDYKNDIAMLKKAKIGVAVANACPEAIEAADYVTVSNEEHAIARIIYDLDEGKLNSFFEK